jgi:hypothetical protein
VTGESLGLLIEEQRTNLKIRSQEFDTWGQTNTTTQPNVAIAPDGTLTADLVFPSTSSSDVRVSRDTTSGMPSSLYVSTVYAKYAGIQWIQVMEPRGFGVAHFDILNGIVGTQGGGASGSTITPVGNGWFRCSVFTETVSVSNFFRIKLTDANGSTTCTASGIKGVFLWGAQTEAGAFPTSYIPTTTATVTRAADAASMTGTNFSSWYRADEGTLFAEVSYIVQKPNIAIFAVSDGTFNNRIGFSRGGTGNESLFGFNVTSSGVTQVGIGNSAPNSNEDVKLIFAYKVNDFQITTNGVGRATDTSGLIPVVSQARIGDIFGSNSMTGTIKKLAYYPARLTNTELQGLTS